MNVLNRPTNHLTGHMVNRRSQSSNSAKGIHSQPNGSGFHSALYEKSSQCSEQEMAYEDFKELQPYYNPLKYNFNEENLRQIQEQWSLIVSQKQKSQVSQIESAYELLGMKEKAPTKYEDTTATDKALIWLNSQKTAVNDFGPRGTFSIICAYRLFQVENGTFGTQYNIDETAADQANTKLFLTNYYSDEAIMERINNLEALGDIDKDLLFQYEKKRGEMEMESFVKSNQQVIEEISRLTAIQVQKKLGAATTDEGMRSDELNALKESFAQLFSELLDKAYTGMKDGYEGNIADKTKEESYLDKDFKFTVEGIEYTRLQLEQLLKPKYY